MCAHVLPKITLPSARCSHHLLGHSGFWCLRKVWEEGALAPPGLVPWAQGYIFLSSSAGGMCPFRHISGEKTVVCKHWLRGLCKKGDQCEFLHEYDMTKMPECYFYSKFGKAVR